MDLTSLFIKLADYDHAKLLSDSSHITMTLLSTLNSRYRKVSAYRRIKLHVPPFRTSPRINCFNFKLAFVLLRLSISALADSKSIGFRIKDIVDRLD